MGYISVRRKLLLTAAALAAVVVTSPASAGRVVGYLDGAGQVVSVNEDGTELRFVGPGTGAPASSSLGSVVFRDGAGNISRAYENGFGSTTLTSGGNDWSPDVAPGGGPIVFRRYDAATAGDIWIMDGAGGGLQQLTSTGADDDSPDLSPDGTQIAFFRAGVGLMVMNLDGGNEHVVLNGIGREPDWSPTGTHIAIADAAPGFFGQQVWIVAADGSDLNDFILPGIPPDAVLTNDPGSAFSPQYTPDGARIMFWSNREFGDGTVDPHNRTFLIDVDGENEEPAGFDGVIFANFAPDLDTTPPQVNIDFPAEGAQFILGDQVYMGSYGCGDSETGLFGGACVLAPPTFVLDTSTLGQHTLSLSAQNTAGLETTLLRNYFVVNQSNSTTESGGGAFTATTGSTASTEDPISTAVAVPTGGTASIEEASLPAGSTPPAGYSFFDQEVTITVLDSGGSPLVQPVDNPLLLMFVIDSTLLGGTDSSGVQVFRDGVPIADCEAPGASPDPCIASREALGSGDARVSVRSTHASRWNVGRRTLSYAFTGFFAPVDNAPVLNTAKAGAAIPVKFKLGGDRGLGVFAAGYPKSTSIPCDSTAPVDGIESTVTAGGSSLSYDTATTQYTYTWKTDNAWSAAPAGPCRQLVLRFADGTERRVSFKFLTK